MRQESLWHNSEHVHANGSIIAPGGYGSGIIAFGDESTAYPGGKSQFYRENLFEYVRVTRSNARSRDSTGHLRSSPENMRCCLLG